MEKRDHENEVEEVERVAHAPTYERVEEEKIGGGALEEMLPWNELNSP